MRRLLAAVFLALAFVAAASARADDVPFLSGRVVDEANILSQGERDRLTAMLKAHEDATTNQIVVLTVPTVGQMSIEEYAVTVFEKWKLGQKGKDNGILVVVAPQDHKLRIEVGYGLESTITDGTAGDIIRTWMTPAFKANNYDKGVEDGVAAIIGKIEGRPVDRTPVTAPAASMSNGAPMPMSTRIVFGVFIFLMLGIFTVVGVVVPGMGWFLYLFLIPFWALFPMVIIGPRPTMYLLGAYLLGFPIAKLSVRNQEWYKKSSREMKTSSRTWSGIASSSGWSSSSGSSWSSSSSSDSFSGGGGDSGGGGASASW